MAPARLRETFRYLADNSDNDDIPLELDEEEQEKLIHKLREEDEKHNEQYKKRFFLAIPTIAAAAFAPALLASRLFQVKLVCLFSMTSLVASAYILAFVPNTKYDAGDGLLSRLERLAHSKREPLQQYLSLLNGGLSLLLSFSAYSLKGKHGVHEGFWLLCFLPVAVFSIIMLARRLMLSVDVGELEKLNMARVRKERAANVGSAAARHKQETRKKAPYRVVLEEVTQKKKLRTYLSFDAVAPRGYTFIPAGDPQLTKRCKQLSKKHGMTVHIVSVSFVSLHFIKPSRLNEQQTGAHTNMELSREVHRVGYHFSTFVVDEACQTLGVTLNASGRVTKSHFASLRDDELQDNQARRQGKGKKTKSRFRKGSPKIDTSLSQAVIDTQAREAIEDLFPKIPRLDLHEIVSRAFDKTRNLVGTASGTSLVRRANLAVVAHIRHTYTNYDELLRSGMTWFDARRGVEKFTLDKLVSWRGDEDDEDDDIMEDVLREVIVISDDEGGESDIEASEGAQKSGGRGSSIEVIHPNALHSLAVDLTTTDDDDSDDDVTLPYQVLGQYSHGHSYDQSKEARIGQQRHMRWEEAVSRHRSDPSQVQQHNARTMALSGQTSTGPLLTGQKRHYIPRQAYKVVVDGQSVASTDRVSLPRRYHSRADINLESGNYVLTTNLGQYSPEARQEPRPTYNNSDQRYGLHNEEGRLLSPPSHRQSSKSVKALDFAGDMGYVYLPYDSRLIPSEQNSNITPSVETKALDQELCAANATQKSVPIRLQNPKLGSFSNEDPFEVRHHNVGDSQNLKWRYVDDSSFLSRQGIPYPHDVQRDGATVLVPLDQPGDGGPMHSAVGDPVPEISGRSFIPVPNQQLKRSPFLQRPLTLGDQAFPGEDKRPLVAHESKPKLRGADQSLSTLTDLGRSLPVNAHEDPRSCAHPSFNSQVSRVIRLSEVADSHTSLHDDQNASTKQGISHGQTIPSNKAMQGAIRSQSRQTSFDKIRGRHDRSANDGWNPYGRLGHRDEPTGSKQVIYLGATSTNSAGPHQRRSRLNKGPQQAAPLVNRESVLDTASGAQQQVEFCRRNPFGEVIPKRNPGERCI
ncbi:MAG: hypothetical protein Q9217_002364 [Psora testacea]